MPWEGSSGIGPADAIGIAIWWMFVGLEVLLFLVMLALHRRIRLRANLLVLSIVANAFFFLNYNYSISTPQAEKYFNGLVWPLLNLAWLVWVLKTRSRSGKRPAKPTRPAS